MSPECWRLRAAESNLPLVYPGLGFWKLLNSPRLKFLEPSYRFLPLLLPDFKTTCADWRSIWGWSWGFPLLLSSIRCCRRSKESGLVLGLAAFWDGGFDERSPHPQDGLLPRIENRDPLPIPSDCFLTVIDQACSSRVETPDNGVQCPHPLIVLGVRLLHSKNDPISEVLRNWIQKDGDQV